MPTVFGQFFSRDHWKNPFTIQVTSVTDQTKIEEAKIGVGKRITVIFLAVTSGVFTLGILAAPVFFLSASAFKNLELYQRRKATKLSGQPGNHQNVPKPGQPTTPKPANDADASSKPTTEQPVKSDKPTSTATSPTMQAPPPPSTPKPNRKRQSKNPQSTNLTQASQTQKLTPTKSKQPNTSKHIHVLTIPEGQDLPLPPPTGIKVGLTNLANTCWLNSSLKFMASTVFWDQIYAMEVNDASLHMTTSEEVVEKFQKDLKDFLSALQNRYHTTKEERDQLRNFVRDYNLLFSKTDLFTVGSKLKPSADFQRRLKNLITNLGQENDAGDNERLITPENQELIGDLVNNNWTTLFDTALIKHAINQNNRYQDKIRDFQKALKNMIYTLRTQEGYIDRSACQKFERLVTNLMRDDTAAGTGGQMDANEFFLTLQRVFDLKDESKNDFFRSVTLYQPIKQNAPLQVDHPLQKTKDNAHFPSFDTSTPIFKITIVPEDAHSKFPISFMEALHNPDITTVRADFAIENEPVELLAEGTEFKTENYPVHLPPLLNLFFPRVVSVVKNGRVVIENGGIKQERCNRPYDIDNNGRITLEEYEAEAIGQYEREPWNISPKNLCTYEICSAIVHGGSSRSGHYVSIQKTENGQYLYHSDRDVRFLSAEEALKKIRNEATFLQFRRVETRPFSKADKLLSLTRGQE